ncbi:MAG: phage terminase large subunit [Burkholderiaceae bacterium]
MIINLPKLHPEQLRIFRDTARFKVLVCGRRWGKTRLAAVAAVATALRGGRVWWIAPTYATSMIGYRLTKRLLSGQPWATPRDGDRAIVVPQVGGEVWFKSADAGDGGLRGEGLDLVIFDEAAYVPEAIWTEAIRPALSDRQGKAIIISTPAGEGDWFHRAHEAGGKRDGWASWQLPSWTNPYLKPEEIEAARADLPSIVFRQEYGAEFVSAAGTRVRREWLRTGRPTDAERQASKITMGVDLAISTKDGADYTAAVVVARHPDGRIWVLDAARTRATFQDVLRFVQAMAAKHSPATILVEQVQFQAAVVSELLRTTSLPVRGVRPDKDKLTRFQPIEARLEQGMVLLDPGLPDDFTKELLAFPLGEHDDQVDALAYAYGGGARTLEWS